MNRLFKALIVAALLVPVTGYSADEQKKEVQQPTATHPPMQSAPAVSSQAAPQEAAKEPDKEVGKEKSFAISGKVVETMNSGGYTYVCLEKNGERTWVAAPQMDVGVGQELTFSQGSQMVNFASKSLNRTFDKILFCGPPVSQTGAMDNEKKSPGSKGAQLATTEKIKVEKAAGANAYTIAEIYKKKAKLHKKQVVIQAKVVKVSAKIMGKNWIHLQDGSGNQKKGTHNLVVTSNDMPAVGDIVTIKGVLIKDKDFGAGYRYDVIVEDAAVKK